MFDERAKQTVKANQALFESALEARKVIRQGKKWRCPWHDDQHPSASLFTGKDGSILFDCRVCNATLDIFGFVARFDNKPVGDAMWELLGNGSTGRPAIHSAKRPDRIFPTLEALIKATPHFVECYEYHDLGRALRMVTLRCEPPGGRKQFRYTHPVGSGFVLTAPPKPWILYRLPDLIDAGTVVVVEGERKADLLAQYGLVATSFAGGIGTPPQNTDCGPLAGKNIILWPDAKDDGGRVFMRAVASHLESLNPVPRISIIEPSVLGLTGKPEGEPAKDDVVDFVRMLKESGVADNDILPKLLDALDTAKTKSAISVLVERHEQIIAGEYRAIDLPWPVLSEAARPLLPGTITVLAGTVGASKSFMVLQAMLSLLARGEDVSLYALEKRKADHLARALAQLTGKAGHTKPDWVAAHAEEVRRDREEHQAELERFAHHLQTTDSLGAETLGQIADWIEQEAKQGRRVICVDPITAATRIGKPWEADQQFLKAVEKVANDYGCSVVLVSHPEKGTSEPTRENLAGGACYERFSTVILTLHNHAEKTSPVRQPLGTLSETYNRTLRIEKAGNSWGTCAKLAYRFDGDSLTLAEIGIIVQKGQ